MIGEEAPPGHNGPHLRAVADVLLDLSFDIEALGTMLCTNTDLMRRHVQELQVIDLIAQKQRSLAAVLRSDCMRSALSEITVEELRAQLDELVAVNGPDTALPN